MRVLEIASEAVPFAKTGGLADVAGALPGALADLGCEVALVMPGHRDAYAKGLPIESTGIEFEVPVGTRRPVARILRCRVPGSGCDAYLVANDEFSTDPRSTADRAITPITPSDSSSFRGPRWNWPAASVDRGTSSTVTIGRPDSCPPTGRWSMQAIPPSPRRGR